MKDQIVKLNEWVSENYPQAKTLEEIDFPSYPYWEAACDSIATEAKQKPIKAWQPEQKLEFLYLLAREEIGILTCFLHSKADYFSDLFNLTIEDIEDLLVTFPQKWNDKNYKNAFAKLVSMTKKGKILNEISDEFLVLVEQYYKDALAETWGKHTAFNVLVSWDYAFYEKYIDQILLEEADDLDYCLSILHRYENELSRLEKYIISLNVEKVLPYTHKKILKKYQYLIKKNSFPND